MNYCEYCGRPLGEGEQCACRGAADAAAAEANNRILAAAVPVTPPPVPAVQTGSIPQEPAAEFMQPQPAAAAAKPKSSRKTGIIIAGAAALLAVIGVLLWFFVLRDSYEKPLKQYFKGLNQFDFKKSAEAVLTDHWYTYAAERYTDGDVDEIKEKLKDMWDEMEDEYEDVEDLEFSYKIVRKKKLKTDKLEEIEEKWQDFFEPGELKEGYQLKVRVTIDGDERAESNTGYYTVVRSEKEGWRLLSNSCKEFSFSRYDDAHGAMVDAIDFH